LERHGKKSVKRSSDVALGGGEGCRGARRPISFKKGNPHAFVSDPGKKWEEYQNHYFLERNIIQRKHIANCRGRTSGKGEIIHREVGAYLVGVHLSAISTTNGRGKVLASHNVGKERKGLESRILKE